MKRLLHITILLGVILMSAVSSLKWRQISDVTTTLTEINYIHGLTSAIQTQLNAKPDTSEVNLIIDNINPHDSVYFKDETYTSSQINALVVGAKKSDLALDLQAMGNDVVSVPYSAITYGTTGAAISSGRVYGVMHIVREAITVTGVEYGQSAVAPSFTANNYNGFDLCSVSAGVLTQITKTVNDANLFTTFGYFRKAFPEPVVLQPGIYFVRALWCSSATTTAPALAICALSGTSDMNTILGTQLKTSFYRSSQTDLVTGETLSGTQPSSLMVALHLY